MILSDRQIIRACTPPSGEPLVTPFITNNVQPASIDVRLGNHFRVFVPHDEGIIDLADPVDITKEVERDTFVLHPGEVALGHTLEVVCIPFNIVGSLMGKSSLGRLFLQIHATAGFLDPGFHGSVTLEMVNLLRVPLRLHAGMLIGQIAFHLMSEPAQKPYQGRYQGDKSVSPSRYQKDGFAVGGKVKGKGSGITVSIHAPETFETGPPGFPPGAGAAAIEIQQRIAAEEERRRRNG